jgi:hypothetical protein
MAEENVLPKSGGEVLDRAGIKDSGYLTKKGEPSGESAMFNDLPPGMNIEDQKNSDIRAQKMVTWAGGLSFPGDGWQ